MNFLLPSLLCQVEKEVIKKEKKKKGNPHPFPVLRVLPYKTEFVTLYYLRVKSKVTGLPNFNSVARGKFFLAE